MRYQTLGVLGYGLQVVALLVLAAVSSVVFTPAFVFRGIEVTSLITPVPALLISLTWLYAGRDTKSGLFTATGVVGILSFATGVVTSLWTSASGTLAAVSPSQGIPTELILLLAVTSVSGLLAVMTFVLETITFFSAGRIFRERMFRLAGWSRIAAVIAAGAFLFIILIIGLLSSVPVSSGTTSTLLSLQIPSPAGLFPHLFGIALGGVYLIMIVPDVFAFIGFRRILSSPKPLQDETQSASVPQAAAARYCTACGSPAIPGARYCGSCGKPL